MILGMGFCFIFVKSLVVRLVLDNAFLDQELLIGGIIYHPHCLMSLGDLTFHDQYIIIYLMFDLLCIVIYVVLWYCLLYLLFVTVILL